jgi:hypothetical protein
MNHGYVIRLNKSVYTVISETCSLLYDYFSTVAGPASCFTGLSLVVDLARCLDGYTVSKEFYTSGGYASAQPISIQRNEWNLFVNRLLSVDDIDCNTVTIPPSLIGIYAVRRFRDYCVVYETTSTSGIYDDGDSW